MVGPVAILGWKAHRQQSPADVRQQACANRPKLGKIVQNQPPLSYRPMSDEPQSAQHIYQELLDKIGAACGVGDFDAYSSYFHLPHLVQSFDDRMTISTRAQLHSMFKDLQRELEVHNVASMTRHCTAAEFQDADMIKGVHQVWLVSRTSEVHDSYISLTTLRCGADGWQVCKSQYAGAETCVLNTVTRKQTPPAPTGAPDTAKHAGRK